mmetsp:Transcript_15810/g.29833  ORF Transcript_15810/g.29833 Transcript_15810/m.29833 type:complete len:253 (-) Transcript_15810:176-934(-)
MVVSNNPIDPIFIKSNVSSSRGRPILLQLMGYPSDVSDNAYNQDTVKPNWESVLCHLKENPSEASYVEDGYYPLDDALWIQTEPVPSQVVVRLLRTFPKAVSAQTYQIAKQNPYTLPEVIRLLRGSDIGVTFTCERSKLIQFMGFPKLKIDQDYDQNDIAPNWGKVRSRLVTHPEEASVMEDTCYPLADALWIENDPVPIDIVQTLISLCPQSLDDGAFVNACENEKTDPNVLSLMFRFDRSIQRGNPKQPA